MKRDTVGKISSDLSQKTPESRDPIEIQREMTKDYIDNLVECVEIHRKKCNISFYVVVITKNEKLMPNVFRNYFAARESCPTPDYDQSVYRFNKDAEQLEYLWTLPAKDVIYHLKDNALLVHSEERELLNFCMEFLDGRLDKLAKQLNGEKANSVLLEN